MWHPPPPLLAPSKTLGRSSSPVSVTSLPPGPSPPPDKILQSSFSKRYWSVFGLQSCPMHWRRVAQRLQPRVEHQLSKNKIRSLGIDSKSNPRRTHSDFELLQEHTVASMNHPRVSQNGLDKWCNLCGNGGGV